MIYTVVRKSKVTELHENRYVYSYRPLEQSMIEAGDEMQKRYRNDSTNSSSPAGGEHLRSSDGLPLGMSNTAPSSPTNRP